MAQHDYVIANGTGAAVRSDINDGLAAIVSQNSGTSEPATMYAYQLWADTTTGELKQRNAANNAWITVGTLASANLGLMPRAGGTFTGEVIFGTTGAIELPDGTTAERPGVPVEGMIRYNTTLDQFEGYKSSNWGAIGGGATGGGGDDVFYENAQTVTQSYTLTTSKNAMSAGPITISSGVTVTVPAGQAWSIV